MTHNAFPNNRRYTYIRTLGQGGMGIVFAALDTELGHPVALKTVLDQSELSIDMLVHEFRARRVDHPNLIRLLDLWVDSQQVFYTMELLEAVDLGCWARSTDPMVHRSTVLREDADPTDSLPQTRSGGRSPFVLQQTRALARLCAQVVSALHTLHETGLVHRDVKPANILVASDERAILADFGLAASFRAAPGEPRRRVLVGGTPGYMAPELLAGYPTPASDFFALGATIVAIVTGSPPRAPAEIGEFADLCPHEGLARLVGRMLAVDECVRPSAEVLVEELSNIAEVAPVPLIPPQLRRNHSLSPTVVAFVGREHELAQLDSAFATIRQQRAALVCVSGPSGVGKTTLIGEWLRQVSVGSRKVCRGVATVHQKNRHQENPRREKNHELVVLRGHCHSHERVPFGGFDNALNNLSDFLLADTSREALTRDLEHLGLVFPQLRSYGGHKSPVNGRQQRLAAFDELAVLLRRIAQTHSLVIWLDDVEFLDADTQSLLNRMLLAGLDGVMLLVSYAGEATSNLEALSQQNAQRFDIRVPRLTPEQVVEMVGEAGGERSPKQLFEITDGLPIFTEILAQARDQDFSDEDPVSCMIRQAIDQVTSSSRQLLSILSLSTQPMRYAVAAEASLSATPAVDLRVLEDAGLISPASQTQDRVTFSHAIIRSVHEKTLSDVEKEQLHERLAGAYESVEPDNCEALTDHYWYAKKWRPAARYALLSAERAEQRLAFAKAIERYERALDRRADYADDWKVRARFATALANDGYSEKAAKEFERVIGLLDVDPPAENPRERLLTRAAAEYFHCGRVKHGYRVLRRVFERRGLKLPRSKRDCVLMSARLRIRFFRRGHRFVPAQEPPQEEVRQRLEALWIACTSLAHINFVLADVFLLEHLHLALDTGVEEHVFRSLTYMAGAEAALGVLFSRRADRLLAAGRAILDAKHEAERSNYNQAWYWISAAARWFFAGDWPRVVACAQKAERYLCAHRVGVGWERSVNNLYWLFALALMGDVEALVERQEIARFDAIRREDALAQNNCRSGYSILVWLYRGDLDTAKKEFNKTLDTERWRDGRAARQTWPENSFRTSDYHNLLARVLIHLYAGEGPQAFDVITKVWKYVESAQLLRIQSVGVGLRYLLGRAALAARKDVLKAKSSESGLNQWTPKSLEKVARRELRKLRRSSHRCATAYAEALRAGMPGLSERRVRQALERAAMAFDELHMKQHANAARHWLGNVQVCPVALARMLVPAPATVRMS